MVEDFVLRYVTKLGLRRIVLNQSKKLKAPDDLVLFPIFGDLQSNIFIGQTILPQILNTNKYNIVVSWPGASGVFHGIDEYWSLNQDYAYKSFHFQAEGINNLSSNYQVVLRSLNENFIHVNDLSEIKKYYKSHLLGNFKNIKSFNLRGHLPNPISSLPYLRQGAKKQVVFIPWTHHRTIVESDAKYEAMDSAVYTEILKRLNYFGYTVYCIQNDWTYNLSEIYNSSDLIYVRDSDIKNIVSYIHHAGCLFDFFTNYGILGYMAQVPTFTVSERNIFCKHFQDMEHYVLNFTNANKNIFSFNYFTKSDTGLNLNVINSIIDKFDDFYEGSVKNYTKVFYKDKIVDMSKYVESCVQKYKPYFISQAMRKKEESKHEKA